VHGSERFTTSVVIDDGVVSALDAFCEIAPLHNPGAVAGIRAARQILSDGSLTGLACVGSQNCEVVTMNFAYAAKAARSCTITFYLIHGMQIAPIRIRDER
jgi:acetate kinase